MPATRVILFRELDGSSPVVDWLRALRKENVRAWAVCLERMKLLAEFGHELRRPACDLLRDGIYELRAKQGRVQYRLLYFFHGRNVAILAHGLTKTDAVPKSDIERALRRKKLFEANPEAHTYED
jgi:phage-related protein